MPLINLFGSVVRKVVKPINLEHRLVNDLVISVLPELHCLVIGIDLDLVFLESLSDEVALGLLGLQFFLD